MRKKNLEQRFTMTNPPEKLIAEKLNKILIN